MTPAATRSAPPAARDLPRKPHGMAFSGRAGLEGPCTGHPGMASSEKPYPCGLRASIKWRISRRSPSLATGDAALPSPCEGEGQGGGAAFDFLGSCPAAADIRRKKQDVTSALVRSNQLAMGAYFRRMCARMDKPRAVTAAAHKLARLIYTMLTKGEEHTDQGQDYFEERYRERVVRQLSLRAEKMGMKLVANPETALALHCQSTTWSVFLEKPHPRNAGRRLKGSPLGIYVKALRT